MTPKPDHAARGHAPFSPSGLKMLKHCKGFKGKEGSSSAAEMGTRIHEALEVRDPFSLHDETEVDIYSTIIEQEKTFMSNFGIEDIDADPQGWEVINETALEMNLGVHRGNPVDTWGTCDRLLIPPCRSFAVLADYKTGISQIDPPQVNTQAKAYTIGVFQRYPTIEEVTFVFYVPQYGQSLAHTFVRSSDYDNLIAEIKGIIIEAAATRPMWDGGQPPVELLTPTENCRFCHYEEKCPALGAVAMDIAGRTGNVLPDDLDPNNFTDPLNLGRLFAIAKMVENWATMVKDKTKQALVDGMDIPNCKLRNMGAPSSVEDNAYFAKIAASYGLSPNDLIEIATLSANKTALALPKEKRAPFLQSLEDAGVMKAGAPRASVQQLSPID